ncbi:MAG: protein phosphatase 2C domain-containing protein [Eubacteriales bacterium]|nr:protein phosphatase 2C domain-containing protein [Eubacteriales bacterium]
MLNNRYELLEELGRGGFAVTYKGIDHLTNRFVSIKKSDYSLALEAKIMTHLKDVPYISHIYDYFREDGNDYLVKRYISGYTLSELKSFGSSINRSHIESWLDSICLILDHMHRLGIIHRDISPGNLIVSGETLYLIDFGAATSYKNKKLRNRNVYKHEGLDSPEYANFEEQGPWTDIYSLASTILYLLTGEGIPTAENRKKYDTVTELLLKSNLTKKQQNAMIRALKLSITERYQSVVEFTNDMLSVIPDSQNAMNIKKVDYLAKTSTESKNVNQDNFMVDQQFRFADHDCNIQGEILCQGQEIHVVAVADGVSSTHNSELASMAISQAISHFVRQYRYSNVYPQLLLEDLLDHMNEKIISLGRKIGMTASTVAIFLWKGDTYYTASIGDSRIYFFHKNKMKLLTSAQTVANQKIRNGEMAVYADYNTLLFYLGKKDVIGSQMAQYSTGKISEGDTVLLCTDGIAKRVPNEKLESILKKKSDKIFDTMWKYSKKNKNVDNCTAIVLKFH